MYHCIIVTFIKQTINILTFLTDTPSLLLSSLPLLLSVRVMSCLHGEWARYAEAMEGASCSVVHSDKSLNSEPVGRYCELGQIIDDLQLLSFASKSFIKILDILTLLIVYN